MKGPVGTEDSSDRMRTVDNDHGDALGWYVSPGWGWRDGRWSSFQPFQVGVCQQGAHLSDGDFIEFQQTLRLGKALRCLDSP